jgi:branched-chain amino acid transport system permease protein
MRSLGFWGLILAALLAGVAFAALNDTEYYFTAAYAILQGLIMAIAWNILGGFTGYVNFGSAGFFAVAAYSTVALHKLLPSIGFDAPLPVYILAAAVLCGLIGLGTGYLTLRLRGVYFAIATLALAIVFQTIVTNWSYVGAGRGETVLTPDPPQLFGGVLSFSSYAKYLFVVMLLLSLTAIAISRYVVRSKFGRGLAAVRDDELAAECMGVPTLRLKLISATLMGALMGVAGATYPFMVSRIEPLSTFSLEVAVNAIAMPMIGGSAFWFGPVLGALLIGVLQQIISVTISSEVNVLLVGVLLVAFVMAAPGGIVGLVHEFLRTAAPARLTPRAVVLIAIAGASLVIGLLEIIFSLQALRGGFDALSLVFDLEAIRSGAATAVLLGVLGLVVGALCIAGSWGLLKLQSWAPSLASAAFVAVIAVTGASLWVELPHVAAQVEQDNAVARLSLQIALAFSRWQSLTIAISASAVLYLQMRDVRKLYRRQPVAARPVPA